MYHFRKNLHPTATLFKLNNLNILATKINKKCKYILK